MKYIVNPSLSWVGYHLINELLHHGHTVYSVQSPITEKQEHLEMFLERNANYIKVDSSNLPNCKIDYCIHLTTDEEAEFPAKSHILISREKMEENERFDTIIEVPYLFGEWMERNECHLKIGSSSIPFDDENFQEEALPVTSITRTVCMLTASKELPRYRRLVRPPFTPREADSEHIAIILADIRAELKKLDAHYKKYAAWY